MSNRRSICFFLMAIAVIAVLHLLVTIEGGAEKMVQRTHLVDGPGMPATMVMIEKQGAPRTVLSRTGAWRLVEPFVADVDEQVVLKLLDSLDYGEIENSLTDQELLRVGGRTRADFGLLDPVLRVSIRRDGDVSSVSFGTETPGGNSVYATIDGEDSVFVVSKSVFVAANLSASDFRRKTLFSVGVESVSSFDIKRASSSFLRFSRDGEGWAMLQPYESPAAAPRVNALLQAVIGASATEYVWPLGASNEVATASAALLAGYGLDAESAVTMSVKCTDGVDRRIAFGSEAKDGLIYALIQNGDAIVTVPAELKDLASEDMSLFADSRLFPVEIQQVSGIKIEDGDTICLLARCEDGSWNMDSPVSAKASPTAVEKLLERIVGLRSIDLDTVGLSVSLSSNLPPRIVSRDSLLGENGRLDDLRSLEMLRISPESVKRITITRGDTSVKPTVIAYDRDRRAWNVESAAQSGTVIAANADAIVAAMSPLKAEKVVKLKVTTADTRVYGLESPTLTVAVDFAKDDAMRRNIRIGESTAGGYYATCGATDAVFILPAAIVKIFSATLVSE